MTSMFKSSAQSLSLALLVLAASALLVSACSPPPSPGMPDLRTPSGITSQTWCQGSEEDSYALLPITDCVVDGLLDESRVVRRAAVTSRGSNQVLLIDSAQAPLNYINLDTAVPGRTGIVVPGGPDLLIDVGIRGLALVSTHGPAGLTLLDIDGGRALARLPLEDSVKDLVHLPGTNTVAWLAGDQSTLHIAEIELSCNELSQTFTRGCDPEVEILEVDTFSFQDAVGLAASANGQLIINQRGSSALARIGVTGAALSECGGAPCALPELELRPQCDDPVRQCDDRYGSTWREPMIIGPMTTTQEGDLLIVAELRRSELLIVDLETGELIEANSGHPIERSVGIPLTGRTATALIPFSGEGLALLPDGGIVRVLARTVFALNSSGVIFAIDLDRIWTVMPADDSERTHLVDQRFRRLQVGNAAPLIRSLICDVPGELSSGRIGTLDERCNLEQLPTLLALDEEDPLTTAWTMANPSTLVGMPMSTTLRYSAEAEALEEFERPDPWYIAEDTWSVTWEGELPRMKRNDLRLEGSTVTYAGAALCEPESGNVVCDSGLDLNLCPAASELCQAGVEPCSIDTDICDLCPDLCTRYQDTCEAGVVPGDILLLNPLIDRDRDPLPSTCAPFIQASVRDNLTLSGHALEYEIVSVTPSSLELAVIDREGVIDSLPPTECIRGHMTGAVRAGGSWVLTGRRSGYDPVSYADAGQCVPWEGRSLDTSRPISGQPFTSRYGLSLHIEDGTMPTPRDFKFQFITERGKSDFALNTGVSVTSAATIDRHNGPQGLLIADDMRNVLILLDIRPANIFDPDRFVFGVVEIF